MFWGLIMEPQKRYTQVVKKDFHISMASLDISNSPKPNSEPAQVMVSYEDKNYLLCTLRSPDMLQCALDLFFEAGTKVSFATNGSGRVHLTGYLAKDEDDFGMDEGDLEEEEDETQEAEAETEILTKKSRTSATSLKEPPKKKIKTENNEEDVDDESDDSDFDFDKLLESNDEEASEEEEGDDDGEEAEDEEASDEEDDDESMDEEGEEDDDEVEEEEVKPQMNGTKQKSKKNKEEKKPANTPKAEKKIKGKPVISTPGPKGKKEQNGVAETKKESKKQPETKQAATKKRTLPGGVVVEDLKEGSGDAASNGKFVHVYYEGRLKSNNKVFDKTQNGPGFGFRLGKGEVIKGWDLGVSGMKVGGKRRITCPPHLAYGAKGSPPVIPPNSTLVFEVEMKKVK